MNPVDIEGKAIHPPRGGDIRPDGDTGQSQALRELQGGGLRGQGRIDQPLELLAGWLLPGANGHVDLLRREALLLGAGVAQAGGEGQAELLFEGLRRLNGGTRLPLAQPYLAIQPYPAGDKVDVVVVGVLVADGHKGGSRRIEAHAAHEGIGHRLPAIRPQALTGGEGQGAMPDGAGDVGAKLADGGELPRQVAGGGAGQVAGDALGPLGAGGLRAGVVDVVERPAEPAAAANFGFHLSPRSRRPIRPTARCRSFSGSPNRTRSASISARSRSHRASSSGGLVCFELPRGAHGRLRFFIVLTRKLASADQVHA